MPRRACLIIRQDSLDLSFGRFWLFLHYGIGDGERHLRRKLRNTLTKHPPFLVQFLYLIGIVCTGDVRVVLSVKILAIFKTAFLLCFRPTRASQITKRSRADLFKIEIWQDQCGDELRLHIEEALAIQRHRPQLNRRDEDMGTGFLIWSALCCLSRSRSCSRYLCADNVAIFLHCFCPIDWLLSLFLMSSSFLFPFFLFSFLPSILSLPRAAFAWTWQRLSSLVCTCVPRSFSRQAWFHNPDFSSVFHKTDDGVDAETFFARFSGIKSTSPLRLLKIYQRSCTWSLKDPSTS